MIKASANSVDVTDGRDDSTSSVARSLLERFGLLSGDSDAKADRDEMALLSTRAWTLARGDAMLRRFL